MKTRRLKPAVKITGFFALLFICIMTIFAIVDTTSSKTFYEDDNYTYVNDYIFDNYYPVINNEVTISKPFVNEKVQLFRNFYDKDSKEEDQAKSIIYHDGIYMQNSGVDYSSEEEFDVTAILPGTITNITEDTLLGKTIEVRYSTELIVMYQSLGNINVQKGDAIIQGQTIAKSGTCSLNSDIKNGLHVEIYKNGSVINPEKYYEKSIKELSEN